jgi:O-antigen/teichoic acid export membrane protein
MRAAHQLLSGGVFVAAGQALAAIGTVAGIRLLTEVLSPETFGTVTLALGIAALAINVGCTPVTQAGLHFFPEFAHRERLVTLRGGLRQALGTAGLWIGGALLAGGAGWISAGGSPAALVAIVAALVGVDALRSLELTFLNAQQRHRRYAAWSVAEAWVRPLAAVLAGLVTGYDAPTVLAAYALASAVLFVVFRDVQAAGPRPADHGESADLAARVRRYALPLVPLGVVGWVNGLGDRYIIGSLLTVADAGVYAASYGLVSRPFLMLGQSIELTIRPVYQAAVTAGDTPRATRLLRTWFTMVLGAGATGVVLTAILQEWLAGLLLGPAFRTGARLMPWIAAGYALLVLAHVFERVCFAHGRTRLVLLVQVSAAVAGVTATLVGTLGWGLDGAARAVPACFLVHLAVATAAARVTHRQLPLLAGSSARD